MKPTKAFRHKREFFHAWQRGILGNRLRTWTTPEEVPASFTGRLMLRPVNGRGGSAPAYEDEVRRALKWWKAQRSEYRANETAPDDRATLQGEVLRDASGLVFFGAERAPADVGKVIRMRDALKQAQHVTGLRAKMLLQRHLSPSSLADLEELLDEYPDHVAEISAYSRFLGVRAGRNTILWELRLY